MVVSQHLQKIIVITYPNENNNERPTNQMCKLRATCGSSHPKYTHKNVKKKIDKWITFSKGK